MATKRAAKTAAPKQKNKGFLRKKFLKLPIWLWLLILIVGIAGMSGEDSTNSPAVNATPTTTVSASGSPEVIMETATDAPTSTPTSTAAPTVEANSTPSPTSVPTATPVPTTDPTAYVLKQGDKNADVKALQKVLISLGWLSGSADGDFGPKTVSAVKAFQVAAGLPITGECDYDTYLSLTSANAPSAPVQVEEEESDDVAYIGNRNTKKFHYPGCSSVDDMKESNKVEFYSRDEATAAGYVPCKRCNP